MVKIVDGLTEGHRAEVSGYVAFSMSAVMDMQDRVVITEILSQILPNVTIASQPIAKNQGVPRGRLGVRNMAIELGAIRRDEPLAEFAFYVCEGL